MNTTPKVKINVVCSLLLKAKGDGSKPLYKTTEQKKNKIKKTSTYTTNTHANGKKTKQKLHSHLKQDY